MSKHFVSVFVDVYSRDLLDRMGAKKFGLSSLIVISLVFSIKLSSASPSPSVEGKFCFKS